MRGMKHNPSILTIGAALAATLTLSACTTFGRGSEPDPAPTPALPTTSDRSTAPAPLPTPDPLPDVPFTSPSTPVEIDTIVSARAAAIRDDFSVAITLSDDEAACVDAAGITEADYIGLFSKGDQPTTSTGVALDRCLTVDHDRSLATWLVDHRFSLDQPSECFERELANYVVEDGWTVFVADTASVGYSAFDPVYTACGEATGSTSVDNEAEARTDAVVDPQLLGEVMAARLSTSFGLDAESSGCLSSMLGTSIEEHGLAALEAAFAGEVDEFDLVSPVARDVYRAIGQCAPLAGVFPTDAAVVGIVRSMGDGVSASGQECLADGFDRYASEAGTDVLFAGFEDLVREHDTDRAIEVATIINGCVAAANEPPTTVAPADVLDAVTAAAAGINYLDTTQTDCLRAAMPGIVEQYGEPTVLGSLERAKDEIGYRDDIVDQVADAAFECL